MVNIDDDMLRVTHYMYFSELGEFAPLSRHIFARHGRRFVEGSLIHPDQEAPQVLPEAAPERGVELATDEHG